MSAGSTATRPQLVTLITVCDVGVGGPTTNVHRRTGRFPGLVPDAGEIPSAGCDGDSPASADIETVDLSSVLVVITTKADERARAGHLSSHASPRGQAAAPARASAIWLISPGQ